jgi:hypothetical protein
MPDDDPLTPATDAELVAALAHGLRFDETGQGAPAGRGTHGADRGRDAGALSRAGRLRGHEATAGEGAPDAGGQITMRAVGHATAPFPRPVAGCRHPTGWRVEDATGMALAYVSTATTTKRA